MCLLTDSLNSVKTTFHLALKYTSHYFFRLFILCLTSLFLPTALSASSQSGKQLYIDNCAICHGDDGKGGMGIPLSMPSFLTSASRHYLKQSIRLGRPGRIMPSFYWMSESEIDILIDYIDSWRDSPAPVWKTDLIKGDSQNGKQLYATHCADCHGKSAQGGKGSGLRFSRQRQLTVAAPALNNQGLLNSASDSMLYHIIKTGRDETPMPSAADLKLSNTDINDLISFIRQFQKSQLSHTPLYNSEPASLIVDSPYNFNDTIENLKRSISGSNFIHIRDQSFFHGFDVEAEPGNRHMIIYFCNFNFLYDALKIDPRVGMFLPCRITVTETNGKVQMMSINPKHLSQLFNNDELDKSCDKMHELYTSILEDASL